MARWVMAASVVGFNSPVGQAVGLFGFSQPGRMVRPPWCGADSCGYTAAGEVVQSHPSATRRSWDDLCLNSPTARAPRYGASGLGRGDFKHPRCPLWGPRRFAPTLRPSWGSIPQAGRPLAFGFPQPGRNGAAEIGASSVGGSFPPHGQARGPSSGLPCPAAWRGRCGAAGGLVTAPRGSANHGACGWLAVAPPGWARPDHARGHGAGSLRGGWGAAAPLARTKTP